MSKLTQDKSLMFVTLPIIVIFFGALIYLLFLRSDNEVNPPGVLNVQNPYEAPEIVGIDSWINTDGESIQDLKGKVVLIDFWTYSCINCIRAIPNIQTWYDKYKDAGLVVVGVHAPEFAFEKQKSNVENAVSEFGITYPVGLDNDFQTWRAYKNRYWPAHYFIDRNGKVRHTHFGEGEYSKSEEVIQILLKEGAQDLAFDPVDDSNDVPPINNQQTPETYFGFERIDRFANQDEIRRNESYSYTLRNNLNKHRWSLGGSWQITPKTASSLQKGSKLRLNGSGKEVYLVMGAAKENLKVKVLVNGENKNLGEDVNEEGYIEVGEYRLYKVVEFDEFTKEFILELEFDEAINIHAFTFGS